MRQTPAWIVLTPLLAVLMTCGVSTPSRQLAPEAASYAPLQVATLLVEEGDEDLRAAEYQGTLGGVPVRLRSLDSRTLLVLIPALSEGPQPLRLELDGTSAQATVHVGPAIPVADATALVAQVESGLVARMDALLAAGPSDPRAVAGLERMREQVRQEAARLRAVGGEELAHTAAVLAANMDVLSYDPLVDTREQGLGTADLPLSAAVCATREPEAAIRCFERRLYIRLALILGSIGLFSGTPPLAYLAVGLQLYAANEWLNNEAQQGVVQVSNLILLDLQGGGARPVVAQSQATADSASLVVHSGQTVRRGVTSQYRTLGLQDASSPAPILASIASSLRRFESGWQRLDALVPFGLGWEPMTLGRIPQLAQLKRVRGQYVRVSVGSQPAGVQVTATLSGDVLEVTSQVAPTVTGVVRVPITLSYEHQDVSKSTTTVTVETQAPVYRVADGSGVLLTGGLSLLDGQPHALSLVQVLGEQSVPASGIDYQAVTVANVNNANVTLQLSHSSTGFTIKPVIKTPDILRPYVYVTFDILYGGRKLQTVSATVNPPYVLSGTADGSGQWNVDDNLTISVNGVVVVSKPFGIHTPVALYIGPGDTLTLVAKDLSPHRCYGSSDLYLVSPGARTSERLATYSHICDNAYPFEPVFLNVSYTVPP